MSHQELNPKRVALVKIWHGTVKPARPPLGLLFVGNSLKKAGYEVTVHHWTKKEGLTRLDEVVAQRPFLVGFSIITGDPLALVAEAAAGLKARLPGLAVLLGGVHATIEPAQCLAEPAVDYLVLGEGERTAVALADRLRDGLPLDDLPGVAFKRDGRSVINQAAPLIEDLDSVDMDWSLVPVEPYVAQEYEGIHRVLFGYVGSRGCPHACGFCYNHFFNRRRWRSQSAEKVVADLNRLIAEHDLEGVFFYDDNFTVNKKWALKVLEGIPAGGLHVETRIDYLSPGFLDDLASRGVASLFLGMETGSDRLLGLLNKGFSTADMRRSLEMLARFPGYLMLSFIVGVPTETIDEFRSTLRLALECLERLPNVGFTLGFYLPYPGTPLYDLCVARGFEPPTDLAGWEKLDRWGGTDMAIPWTEGYELMSGEVRKLRFLFRDLIALKGRRDPWARFWRRVLRLRILNSGTPAGRRLALLVEAQKKFLKRYKRLKEKLGRG